VRKEKDGYQKKKDRSGSDNGDDSDFGICGDNAGDGGTVSYTRRCRYRQCSSRRGLLARGEIK